MQLSRFFDAVRQQGRNLRNAHSEFQARRALSALPPRLQQDIGWPDTCLAERISRGPSRN